MEHREILSRWGLESETDLAALDGDRLGWLRDELDNRRDKAEERVHYEIEDPAVAEAYREAVGELDLELERRAEHGVPAPA